MRLIGLTGGIATGKSTVARLLAARGAAIVDADALAREVVRPGAPAFDEVVARFGAGVLDDSGAVDRAALGAIVFADPGLLGQLEEITHPHIRALMGERIAAALRSAAPLVVADIALLFEGQRSGDFEGTLLVYAPAAVQLERLRDRDGLDDLSARQRLRAQLPIDDKRELATWVIDNSGSRESTAAQVETWWGEVVAPGRADD
jgi:dephospho-CoA kinase